jgi:hypothetical protein
MLAASVPSAHADRWKNRSLPSPGLACFAPQSLNGIVFPRSAQRSWNNNANNLRSAYRNHNQPDNRNNNVGFRVEATYTRDRRRLETRVFVQFRRKYATLKSKVTHAGNL